MLRIGQIGIPAAKRVNRDISEGTVSLLADWSVSYANSFSELRIDREVFQFGGGRRRYWSGAESRLDRIRVQFRPKFGGKSNGRPISDRHPTAKHGPIPVQIVSPPPLKNIPPKNGNDS